MKRSSSGSQSKKNRSRKLVKNRLQIGDSRLSISTHPGNRDTVPKITRSNVGMQNFYADNTSGSRMKQVDGGTFKKEIRPKSDRAKAVYGSRKKAMRKAYMSDGTGTNKKKKSRTTRGSMKLKPRDTNTSGTNSIGQVFSPERPRSRRRKRTLI